MSQFLFGYYKTFLFGTLPLTTSHILIMTTKNSTMASKMGTQTLGTLELAIYSIGIIHGSILSFRHLLQYLLINRHLIPCLGYSSSLCEGNRNNIIEHSLFLYLRIHSHEY